MRRTYQIGLIFICFLYGSIKAVDWWKHRHLITLDAENAEVYPLLQKVASQAAVPILASTNTQGKVTVHFYRTPIEEALNVISDQVDGRWQKVFLVGRSPSAFDSMSKKIAQEGPPFLVTQNRGTSSVNSDSPSQLTLMVQDKPFKTAALELALKSKTSIVVDDILNPNVSFELKNQSLDAAVSKLAIASKAKFEQIYYFRKWGGRGRSGGSQNNGSETSQNWQEARDARQTMMEQQLALLSPEEREKIQQQSTNWRNLTPEERQKRFEQMAKDPKVQERFDQRALNRIKNLTPEQRVERYQRYVARQKQRAQ